MNFSLESRLFVVLIGWGELKWIESTLTLLKILYFDLKIWATSSAIYQSKFCCFFISFVHTPAQIKMPKWDWHVVC